MEDVLALILGGGQGTRLFPLTLMRSKPAVPIGGQYRLIDVAVSNCLHAGVRRIFVLTQFNSASLNRHIAQTYRLDLFAGGFVEILAAEQTPDNPHWFQGTADAVRQGARHFLNYEADYFLILAGDHLYRMDFADLIERHIEQRADVTIAAQPVSVNDAPAMGIFWFDLEGQIVGFEEKPSPARLAELGSSAPAGTTLLLQSRDRPFVASMGIYVFSRDVLIEMLERPGVDFGREIIPAALRTHHVHAYLHRDYWADVGTIEAFYDANIMLTQPDAPFTFYHPRRPVFTHPRFLPPSRMEGCTLTQAVVAQGCVLDRCVIERSVVGIRTCVGAGARVTRSVLLGADYYGTDPAVADRSRPGIGADVVIDRAIVDKNAAIGAGARLVNERGVENLDGDGYFIRGGIIVVPKGGRIPEGTTI